MASAAYEWLESEGLIQGAVGRGSFVLGAATQSKPANTGIDWSRTLTPSVFTSSGGPAPNVVDFSSSRPSGTTLPARSLFRKTSRAEALANPAPPSLLLQLGSPLGYAPLRNWLLTQAKQQTTASDTDDILITNGCQQALDILRRALIRPGTKVAIEEPVYPGLRNLFLDAGADLIGIPVTTDGLDLNALLYRALGNAKQPRREKVVVVTPSIPESNGGHRIRRRRAQIASSR